MSHEKRKITNRSKGKEDDSNDVDFVSKECPFGVKEADNSGIEKVCEDRMLLVACFIISPPHHLIPYHLITLSSFHFTSLLLLLLVLLLLFMLLLLLLILILLFNFVCVFLAFHLQNQSC